MIIHLCIHFVHLKIRNLSLAVNLHTHESPIDKSALLIMVHAFKDLSTSLQSWPSQS